ncbi:chemotaxis protein CheW [Aureimonas jatrophae]|jgi:purine-binding chemotaxis protein CheW|uniref:CheW protein n=1 Tax=Aureimonas jatrophae TaxID=1166073 RepID=A0A1H0CUA9_9HYPH|nr:chemotaxis protein CheW [Aureimonas jatrophae]MBB3951651.1 purine-binding chemotaxis protein CheW [Aureimonas jatrophae]SDN61456.1 CheW protein [Aureimonas jatrophae]
MSQPFRSAFGESETESESAEMLTFQLGSGAFAVNVRQVREVLDHKPIQPLANAPASLLGMIDVRGAGVPVVDLKRKLRMPDSEMRPVTGDTRIVVLEFEAAGETQTIAVIADAVHEVVDLADQVVEMPPHVGEAWDTTFMQGLGRRNESFLTLLRADHLFSAGEGVVLGRAA